LRCNQPIIIHGAKLRTRVYECDGGKREFGSEVFLFQFDHRVVGADRVHGLDSNLFDDSIAVGTDALFHLHGFYHANLLAGGNLVAWPNQDGDHTS